MEKSSLLKLCGKLKVLNIYFFISFSLYISLSIVSLSKSKILLNSPCVRVRALRKLNRQFTVFVYLSFLYCLCSLFLSFIFLSFVLFFLLFLFSLSKQVNLFSISLSIKVYLFVRACACVNVAKSSIQSNKSCLKVHASTKKCKNMAKSAKND